MADARAASHCWAEGCAAPSTSACARCRTAEYCGAPCQRAHWRAHKPRCKELEAAADAAEAAAEAAATAAAALGTGGGGAGEVKPPRAVPRTPGVYTDLECRVQDHHCALVDASAADVAVVFGVAAADIAGSAASFAAIPAAAAAATSSCLNVDAAEFVPLFAAAQGAHPGPDGQPHFSCALSRDLIGQLEASLVPGSPLGLALAASSPCLRVIMDALFEGFKRGLSVKSGNTTAGLLLGVNKCLFLIHSSDMPLTATADCLGPLTRALESARCGSLSESLAKTVLMEAVRTSALVLEASQPFQCFALPPLPVPLNNGPSFGVAVAQVAFLPIFPAAPVQEDLRQHIESILAQFKPGGFTFSTAFAVVGGQAYGVEDPRAQVAGSRKRDVDIIFLHVWEEALKRLFISFLYTMCTFVGVPAIIPVDGVEVLSNVACILGGLYLDFSFQNSSSRSLSGSSYIATLSAHLPGFAQLLLLSKRMAGGTVKSWSAVNLLLLYFRCAAPAGRRLFPLMYCADVQYGRGSAALTPASLPCAPYSASALEIQCQDAAIFFKRLLNALSLARDNRRPVDAVCGVNSGGVGYFKLSGESVRPPPSGCVVFLRPGFSKVTVSAGEFESFVLAWEKFVTS